MALCLATTTSSGVRFDTINRATGNRVKQKYVNPVSDDDVEPDDRVKGHEVGRGSYDFVQGGELDAIRIESTHTINIESFVLVEQVMTSRRSSTSPRTTR